MIPLTPFQCQFWTEQQDIVVVDIDWLGIDIVSADIDVVLEYIDIALVGIGIDLIDIVLAGIDYQSHIEYNYFLLNL